MKRSHISAFRSPLSAFRFSLSAFLVLLFASCEKVVEFDIEQTEPSVVVNALPMTDSLMFVNITYSRFFLDNQTFRPVTDATVSVDINGTPLTLDQRDGANYGCTYRIAGGDSLVLHVQANGKTITGATRAPLLPAITIDSAIIDTLQPFTTGGISFTLDDPAAVRNHYLVYISERDSGTRWNRWEERWDTIDTVVHSYFNCLNREVTDPAVNRAEGMMDYFNQLLFSDSLIDGQQYSLTLAIPMLRDTAEHPIERSYTLVVESLSPEAFRYIVAVGKAQGIGQYFAEPARIYTNLSGGLGIFAAIARREYAITFTYKQPEVPQTGKSRNR